MKFVKIKIALAITMLISSGFLFADNNTIMQQANAAYQAQKYQQAKNLYLTIVKSGNEGAILFYNLGNACFKNGEKATSLLWYERALRLDPSNEDIKHNIAFVNQNITDKIEEVPDFILFRWWNSLSMSLTATNWAIASIIFAFLLVTGMIIMLVTPQQWLRSSGFVFALVMMIMLVMSTIFAHKESVRYKNNPEAIVMQSVLNAKSTPNESGADLFIIHEGLKVIITDRLNEWYEIKIPNGEKGWVNKKSIEII